MTTLEDRLNEIIARYDLNGLMGGLPGDDIDGFDEDPEAALRANPWLQVVEHPSGDKYTFTRAPARSKA